MPRALFLAVLICVASFARADASTMPGINQAQLAGQATLRWFGVKVYDAELFTPNGEPYKRGSAAALRLRYNVEFSREELVGATIKELVRLENAQADHEVLRRKLGNCFAAVGKKDQFLALAPKADQIKFYLNGRQTCSLSHPDIRGRFLDIWLSPNSRNPRLSERLRGS